MTMPTDQPGVFYYHPEPVAPVDEDWARVMAEGADLIDASGTVIGRVDPARPDPDDESLFTATFTPAHELEETQ